MLRVERVLALVEDTPSQGRKVKHTYVARRTSRSSTRLRGGPEVRGGFVQDVDTPGQPASEVRGGFVQDVDTPGQPA